MLKIKIKNKQGYDSFMCKFIEVNEQTVVLEHSLASLALWESKWHKPFLSKNEKTIEETNDYIRCMIVEGDIDESLPIEFVFAEHIDTINNYILDSMTATWFSEKPNQKPSREVITAEIIYYWMTTLNIPFECEKWHLNRLLTLIRVCSIKNAPPKKMNKRDVMRNNASLNRARRAARNSKG